jgi:hypothetical protein
MRAARRVSGLAMVVGGKEEEREADRGSPVYIWRRVVLGDVWSGPSIDAGTGGATQAPRYIEKEAQPTLCISASR